MRAEQQIAKKRRSQGLPAARRRCILGRSSNTSRSVPDVAQTGDVEVRPVGARLHPSSAKRAPNPPEAVAGVGPKGAGKFRELALGFRGWPVNALGIEEPGRRRRGQAS